MESLQDCVLKTQFKGRLAQLGKIYRIDNKLVFRKDLNQGDFFRMAGAWTLDCGLHGWLRRAGVQEIHYLYRPTAVVYALSLENIAKFSWPPKKMNTRLQYIVPVSHWKIIQKYSVPWINKILEIPAQEIAA